MFLEATSCFTVSRGTALCSSKSALFPGLNAWNTNEDELCPGICVALNLIQPILLNVIEALQVGDVVDQQHCICIYIAIHLLL